ncbi:UDP-glucose 4-epimerase [compost metagenome]
MILVTGANGFLGKHICQAIPAAELCTLSRTDARMAIDICKPFQLPDEQFSTIIHTAGKAHSIPQTEAEEQEFYKVNAEGTKHLLQALEQLSTLPKAFVLISTVAVYGLEQGINISEDTPLQASSAYGKSKIMAEATVQQWCRKHHVRCTILRLPLLAGAHAPGNLGKMQHAIQKGRYYNIAGGRAHKSMVLASDVATAIMPLSAIGGVYHLTDGQHPTFAALSQAMAAKAGKKKPLSIPYILARLLAGLGTFIPGFPLNRSTLEKMTADLTFNDDKARSTGAWAPQSVLDFYR